MTKKSTLAKLLASENLTVVHDARQKTASFDVKNRVLMLPVFKDMSDDVYDLFVGHEVGHALWTKLEDIQNLENKTNEYHTVINIVEDARIEKLIKRLYPGLKRNFAKGYTELFEDGFFGIDVTDETDVDFELSEMVFLDRLNIHFKSLGNYKIDIPFQEDEKPFIKMLSELETFEDVVNASNAIWNYLKENPTESQPQSETKTELRPQSESESQDQPKDGGKMSTDTGEETGETQDGQSEKLENDLPQGEETGETQDGQSTDTDEETGEESNQPGSGMQSTSPFDTVSDKMLKSAFENDGVDIHKVNHKSNRALFYNASSIKFNPDDFVISSDKIWEILNNHYYAVGQRLAENEAAIKKAGNFVRKENQSVVDYLAKQFDMKKAANSYKNTTVNRTGIIDMKKLHSYHFNDEIFLSSTSTPDEKNHGFVALVDWSISMRNEISATIDQLINVALFCRKVGIPFQAFAFTNQIFGEQNYSSKFTVDGLSTTSESFSLLELFSANSSKQKFNRELGVVHYLASMNSDNYYKFTSTFGSVTFNYSPFTLSGTPLNVALLVMPDLINKLKNVTKSEKMTFMVLTDGYDSKGIIANNKIVSLTNPVTRKPVDTYDTLDLYGYIKAKTDSKVIVIDITSHSKFSNYTNKYDWVSGQDRQSEKAKNVNQYEFGKKYKKVGFQIYTDNGFDAAYMIHPRSLKIDNGDFLAKVDDDATIGKISSAFRKGIKKKLTNRIMLNHFIETIA